MDLNSKEVVPIVYEAVKNYTGSYFKPKQNCPIDCHCTWTYVVIKFLKLTANILAALLLLYF